MNIFLFFLISIFYIYMIHAQQPYVGIATTDCGNTDNTTSSFGYTCNGLNKTCQSYLTFRSQPPYNNISSISTLLGSNSSQTSTLNSVSDENAVFETDKLILVPVTCSCSGNYYQHNTSYVIQSGDTYLVIANNTYQGLSTCQTLQEQNSNSVANDLVIGAKLVVPLRCACPTKNQTDEGTKYLLSYLNPWDQQISVIASMFGVDTSKIFEANSLSEDSTTYPFTTLLVPLEKAPTVSQTIAPPPPPFSPPPPLVTVSPPSTSSDKTWLYVVIGVVGGGVLIIIMGIILFCVFFRKTKEKKPDSILTTESFEAVDKSLFDLKVDMDSKEFMDSLSDIAKSLKVYTFEEIKSATENFSPSCWIKGSVYRGKIKGDFCAIKKMNGDVSEEINVLSKISHFNLIRLSGVCFNEGSWYLVYEYAVNGALSEWISNNNDDNKVLSFSQRVQIASDVATGLNYIHNYTSPPYVHKDVKSSNVLLDGEFRAKIANFGLARSAGGNEGDFVLTRHIVGTKGYMAPEYIENGFISTKLDVYSFGILVLELLTGKEVSSLFEEVKTNLSEVLYPVISGENGKKKLMDIMDDNLEGNYPEEMAILVAKLVRDCMEKDPSARPGMGEIVQSLSRIFNSSLNWEMSNSISGY